MRHDIVVDRGALRLVGDRREHEIQLVAHDGCGFIHTVAGLHVAQQANPLAPRKDLGHHVEHAVNDAPGRDRPEDGEEQLLTIACRKRRVDHAEIEQNAVGQREKQRKENAEEDGKQRVDGIEKLAHNGAQDAFSGRGAYPAICPACDLRHVRW